MNQKLNLEVSNSDIERAVFELGPYKAPGPEGLNGLFFQKNWDIIKGDVFLAVNFLFLSNWQFGGGRKSYPSDLNSKNSQS